jgi:hypothetical protein
MRSKFRTLSKAISTLVVLCVLVVGMSMDAAAQQRGRNWGRNNRGRHVGWTRGRRVGQFRRDDNDRSNWRQRVRRERRFERRQRRSNWDGDRNSQRSRVRQSSGNWRRRN